MHGSYSGKSTPRSPSGSRRSYFRSIFVTFATYRSSIAGSRPTCTLSSWRPNRANGRRRLCPGRFAGDGTIVLSYDSVRDLATHSSGS